MQGALSQVHIFQIQRAHFGNEEARIPQHSQQRSIASDRIVHCRRSIRLRPVAGIKQAFKRLLLNDAQTPLLSP